MKIIEVYDKRSQKEFIKLPKTLYKDDPTWVCPMDNEIEAIFDPRKNDYFNHGEVARYLLKDDKGIVIGRIAVFIDRNLAFSYDQPTGGIGFFECINDQEAANMLFDTAKRWLTFRKIEAMDGPINFGETDKYWGLLVDGFTHPSYEIAYNFSYYQSLFETYGFLTYYNQEGFHLDLKKPLPPKFEKIATWVSNKPEYTFEHLDFKQIDRQIGDFVAVFNETWATFKENFKPIEKKYIIATLKKVKAIIEPEFIWIAYHKKKPVTIYLMYPDVNMILKHMNGNMNLFNKLKFLSLKKKNTMTRARGVLMGTRPEFQGRGIEAAIIMQLQKVFERKDHYTEIEFSWVGDFNPKMKKIFLSVGTVQVKTYKTYRYLFDRSKAFKRCPIPEIK